MCLPTRGGRSDPQFPMGNTPSFRRPGTASQTRDVLREEIRPFLLTRVQDSISFKSKTRSITRTPKGTSV
jgi:hypothetical protein